MFERSACKVGPGEPALPPMEGGKFSKHAGNGLGSPHTNLSSKHFELSSRKQFTPAIPTFSFAFPSQLPAKPKFKGQTVRELHRLWEVQASRVGWRRHVGVVHCRRVRRRPTLTDVRRWAGR